MSSGTKTTPTAEARILFSIGASAREVADLCGITALPMTEDAP